MTSAVSSSSSSSAASYHQAALQHQHQLYYTTSSAMTATTATSRASTRLSDSEASSVDSGCYAVGPNSPGCGYGGYGVTMMMDVVSDQDDNATDGAEAAEDAEHGRNDADDSVPDEAEGQGGDDIAGERESDTVADEAASYCWGQFKSRDAFVEMHVC